MFIFLLTFTFYWQGSNISIAVCRSFLQPGLTSPVFPFNDTVDYVSVNLGSAYLIDLVLLVLLRLPGVPDLARYGFS